MAAFKDLTGIAFGKLVAVSRANYKVCGKLVWVCSCECGKTISVIGSHLSSGHTKSCGCSTWERGKTTGAALRKNGIASAEKMIGRIYGSILVESVAEGMGDGVLLNCKCGCGNYLVALASQIRRGKRISCGCIGRSRASARLRRHSFKERSLSEDMIRKIRNDDRSNVAIASDFGVSDSLVSKIRRKIIYANIP